MTPPASPRRTARADGGAFWTKPPAKAKSRHPICAQDACPNSRWVRLAPPGGESTVASFVTGGGSVLTIVKSSIFNPGSILHRWVRLSAGATCSAPELTQTAGGFVLRRLEQSTPRWLRSSADAACTARAYPNRHWLRFAPPCI